MVQNQGMPNPGYPFVDKAGNVNPVWFQFLSSLWQRTGGGSNSGNVQSISVSSGSGITSSVVDSNGNAAINLSLGAISPTSIDCSGGISGVSGYFSGGLTTLGTLQFGTVVSSPIGCTGYIVIADVDGSLQRVMVG